MNRVEFYLLAFLILLFLPAINRCQDAKMAITEPSGHEVLSAEDTVEALKPHTLENNGSDDNPPDKSSCINIELPVTTEVWGLEIVIDSKENLETLQEIFEEIDDDEDELSLLFPMTMIAADHSELTINNAEEFQYLTNDCIENGDDDEVESVNFDYHFSMSLFDTNI